MHEGKMNLVFIYGPPGVGKLSVARELGRATGYKLFDNHVSIACAESVFDFGPKPFGRVVDVVQTTVVEEAASTLVALVGTFGYANPEDKPFVEPGFDLVESQPRSGLL